MKKILKLIYFIIFTISFLTFCILTVFAKTESIIPFPIIIGEIVCLILITVPLLLWTALRIKNYFSISYRRLCYCGDDLFDELVFYRNHFGESTEHYADLINAIDFYYKKGGKVDTIVGCDLKRLYKRRDFLNTQLNMKEYSITCISSAGLSIVATLLINFIYNFTNSSLYGIIYQTFLFLFLFALFFAILLLKNYADPLDESDRPYAYELKLLDLKIKKAEKKKHIDYQREDFLMTKQVVLRCLIQKRWHIHGKKAVEIINDIRIIEKINLNLPDYESFNEIPFYLGKKHERGVLFLDDKGHLANEQYEKLYQVLIKYGLISTLPEI